jgi:hypothetical protein
MDREYDLYERMIDGSLNWRGFARGVEEARQRLHRFSVETGHACFAVNLPTKDVIGMNRPAEARR